MKRYQLFTLVLVILLLSFAVPMSYAEQDIAPYMNPDLPAEERVEDLLARMSLDEKIGQMTLVEIGSIKPEDITSMFIGGILSGGGGFPQPNTVEAWAERTDMLMEQALQAPLAIPIIYGVDAVHGHNNVGGAVIFPHNIGLGATHNPDLVRLIGEATACDMLATGIPWNYAPVLAVPQDIRWGRTYEGFAQDTALVSEFGAAFIEGSQGESISDPDSILATAKHFVGDGGAQWGTSRSYPIDQGDTIVDEATLRAIHLPPYVAALEAGAMSVMASFSSWNGTKMHAEQYLITDVLKGELGFEGFVVSDWQGIDQISSDFYESVVTSINAGVDMNMVPYDYERFITTMQLAVTRGDISQERIDDAVRRILRVKFMMGLFEQPFSDAARLESFSNQAFRDLAREAASQSAVLLQNENDVLPIATDVSTVFIAGSGSDNLLMQVGGWTLTWQGGSGRIEGGTSIKDGIEALVSPETQVIHNRLGRFEEALDADGNPLRANVGIVVIGEEPYAEGVGDEGDLRLSSVDVAVVERMSESADTVVVVLLSGRPLIITDHLDKADAWVAAWLPGSEGQGIADVLFGQHPFTGTLSYYWPRSMEQIPLDELLASDEAPLFPIGHGITTGTTVGIPLPDINCSGEATLDTSSESEVLALPATPDEILPGWNLVWNDEFDGDSVDNTKWVPETAGTGFGNAELQYYTDEPENLRVEAGNLVIEAHEERYMGLNYTSAKIRTMVLAQWAYGRFDIRARLPEGQGMWPAFWMLPYPLRYGGWPAGGEIDIMEYLGHETNRVYGTIHYGDYDSQSGDFVLEEGSFADDFHVFTFIWEEEAMRWYIDGVHFQTFTDWYTQNAPYPAPFDATFYLQLNLAVGGVWPGNPDETTVFPQQLLVDYVRVYQQSN
jgi:beta-glucosidase